MEPDREQSSARRLGDDDGVTLVLFALMVTMLVLVAALAIDGGRAYANRRQMQNAADVAAMSGTRYLAEHRATPPATMSDLVDQVVGQATANEADATADQLDCWMVDGSLEPQRLPLGSPIDICENPETSWSAFSDAVGVEVVAAREQQTFLAGIGGIDALNARGSATATIQPLVLVAGESPFIVCAVRDGITGEGNDILDGSNQIKPSAIGMWVGLQGSDGRNSSLYDCGAGASFDGKAGASPIVLNAWNEGDNGNGMSQAVLDQVVGNDPDCLGPGSTPAATDCLVLLPLATEGKGNNPSELYVVAWGVFRVWGNGNNGGPVCSDRSLFGSPTPKYCGILVGPGEISSGTGGTGSVGPNEPYVLKLVE